MSENNHTPEPYSVFTVYAHPEIRDSNGDFVAALGAGDVVRARRFVACVNACAGTSDDDLAEIQHYGGVERVFEFWKQAEKQRDDLRAALRITRGNVASLGPAGAINPYTPYREWLAMIDSAIAAAQSSGQPEKPAETEKPAIVFYPAGSLGEEIEEEGRPG